MANKMVYQFRRGPPRAGLDAQEVGESLSKLEKKHGSLEAEHVVEDARPASSPMHNAFDWDDSVAAQQWRLEQARTLIRSVIVVAAPRVISIPEDMRAFVSIPIGDSGKREYQNIVRVMSDREKRSALLKQAFAEISAWRKRYAILEEFSEIFEIIDDTELVTPEASAHVKPEPKNSGKTA